MSWNPFKLFPNKVNIYSDEEKGIFAYEIDQPESPFAPSKVRYFRDSKRGILKFSSQKKQIENKESRELIEV